MKIHGWKIHHEGNRIRLSRGTRHHYLTRIDGEWRQTTKDGAPALKKIPARDVEAILRELSVKRLNERRERES